MKRVSTRDYRFSDADLIQITDDVYGSANRDLPTLANYGVNAAQLTSLLALRNAFSAQPTDEVLMGYIRIATFDKNITRVEVLKQIRQIAERAKIKYGAKAPAYKLFAVELLSKQRDAELVRVGERVVNVATELLDQLLTEGVTQGIVDALAAQVQLFDEEIDNKVSKVKQRDIAVDERIEAGNMLYAALVKIAAKGKLCWIDTSEAKYNDYVLTETRSHIGQVVEGTIGAGDVTNISVTGVSANTSLILTNTGTSGLNFYFAADPTDETGPGVVTVAPGTTQTLSAVALGFVAVTFSRFNVFNPTTEEGSYNVEWV